MISGFICCTINSSNFNFYFLSLDFFDFLNFLSIGPFPFKLNLYLCKEKAKFFTTARKSMLKLVKLPSLGAKCCKIRKIYACEVCKFRIFLYYARKSLTTSGEFRPFCGEAFPCVIQKYTKFANFASVFFPYFTIFRQQTWQFY